MISISIFSFVVLKVFIFAASFFYNLLGFMWVQLFQILPIMLEEIQLHGAAAIFATTCYIGVLVIAVFIPETKGKNLVSPENV